MKQIPKTLTLLGLIVASALTIGFGCGDDDDNPVKPKNHAPEKPQIGIPLGAPPHQSGGQSITPTLHWICSDPDGDSLTYDVHFGTSSTPPVVSSSQTGTAYSPGVLKYSSIYYWRIVARDPHGGTTGSDTWHFTTGSEPTTPVLSVSPSSLDFDSTRTSMNLSVNNMGPGSLEWNAASDRNWITVVPATGNTTTETDQIIVSVNRSGLISGQHSGEIIISSNGGSDTVNVSMTVAPAPILAVSPDTLDFGFTTLNAQVSISNLGTGTLTWSVSDNQPWLTVSPTNGSTTTETDPITVSVNRSGLDCGSYSGIVTVSSNGGDKTVLIRMQVAGSSNLIVSPNSFDFGANQTTLCFTLSNSDCACGSCNWTASDNCSWLTVSPSSGSVGCQTENICLIVNRNGMACGNYSCNITVSSNCGTITLFVTMQVAGSPGLVVSRSSLDFGNAQTSKSFIITNAKSECGTLTWNISDNKGWITVSPTSGQTTTGSNDITVTVDRNGLSDDSYFGSVSVSSNGGNESVSVSMDVICNSDVLYATADASVLALAPDQNYGSDSLIIIGTNTFALGFVRFDLSSIPQGSTINDAVLRLYCNDPGSGYAVFARASASWTESGITWNNRPGWISQPYKTSTPPGSGRWWEIDVKTIVEEWITNSQPNRGLYMEGTGNAIYVQSRETWKKPQLYISYCP